MTNTHRSTGRVRSGTAAGFSLVEVMISVGIMTAIMAATMGALSQAMKANETAVLVTGMNNNLRTGMDLMMRDLLQVGSGLRPGHFILIPSGAGERINMPGPPGTAYLSTVGDVDINAVNPGARLGPLVNQSAGTACAVEGPTCVRTDMITTLAADSTFTDIALTARAANGTTITVVPSVNITDGPDRVVKGQLIMLERGAYTLLVQVTADPVGQVITFAANDSLRLNVHNALSGSAVALSNFAPPELDLVPVAPATVLSTTATRIRMISYYIDNTKPAHPTLVRRINNGHPTVFDNASGSTVAFDIDNLQITYDIADGAGNPANQECLPLACSVNQIRKVNVSLSARSRSVFTATKKYYRNTLSTQVSLRGMSFVNDYVQ